MKGKITEGSFLGNVAGLGVGRRRLTLRPGEPAGDAKGENSRSHIFSSYANSDVAESHLPRPCPTQSVT